MSSSSPPPVAAAAGAYKSWVEYWVPERPALSPANSAKITGMTAFPERFLGIVCKNEQDLRVYAAYLRAVVDKEPSMDWKGLNEQFRAAVIQQACKWYKMEPVPPPNVRWLLEEAQTLPVPPAPTELFLRSRRPSLLRFSLAFRLSMAVCPSPWMFELLVMLEQEHVDFPWHWVFRPRWSDQMAEILLRVVMWDWPDGAARVDGDRWAFTHQYVTGLLGQTIGHLYHHVVTEVTAGDEQRKGEATVDPRQQQELAAREFKEVEAPPHELPVIAATPLVVEERKVPPSAESRSNSLTDEFVHVD
jgi:hypothetical protein